MSDPSLVMIPGLNCTGRLFEQLGGALGDDFAVSIAQAGREMTIARDARAILADAPPSFTLLGLSLGGYLAFEVWRQAPERVERMILLDTSARPDTPEQTERRMAQIALAEAGRFDEVPHLQYPMLVHASRENDEALRAVVVRMARDTGATRFVNQERVIISRPDSRPDLAAISCPVLVVVGDGDRLTPPDLAREIADGIPGARLETIRECGHLSTLERPKEVEDIVLPWLGVRPRD